MKKITFIQTCDPLKYVSMLMETSRTVLPYCKKNGFSLDLFIGIKRGDKPWHAALNRIPMLKSYADAGYDGWIIYLDSDAYISDQDFDIASYLEKNENFAMIAAPSGMVPPQWWDINNGVFAINLSHPKATQVISHWYDKLYSISEGELSTENAWGDVVDDQSILHQAMLETHDFEPHLLRDDSVFNWDSCFIRQIVRNKGDFDFRLKSLREAVQQSLEGHTQGIKYIDDRIDKAQDHRINAIQSENVELKIMYAELAIKSRHFKDSK